MKILKFDHNLAELIRKGIKTSTWRLYDDKDLSVDDVVQIIDKVDPKRPETWLSVGTAKIDSVVQKRLGDVAQEEAAGHESYASEEELLSYYRNFYGPQVNLETPVKVIRFTFNNATSDTEAAKLENIDLKAFKLFSDGGSRGNPGPSASGFVLFDSKGKEVIKKGLYLGITTNNQAEYQSLKLGLEEALVLGVSKLDIYMDSMLVINQMTGKFKVKNRDLWPIYEACKLLAAKFSKVTFTHVPREMNKIADAEVNTALDKHTR